jgi:hypothetical protein
MVFPRAKLMDGVAHAKGVSSCTMEILSQRLRVICVPRSWARLLCTKIFRIRCHVDSNEAPTQHKHE